MHIVGLVWSGGYGVQRKVAGAEQVLRSTGEIAGMGLMGLGVAETQARRLVEQAAVALGPDASVSDLVRAGRKEMGR